jgi:dCTP deaminase
MTLTDRDIAEAIAKESLVLEADKNRIGAACYELRMGSVYYDLTEADRRIEVGDGEKILIKPGHRVVLITLERLVVPPDILARVVSKGSLFTVGLSPVCTYADPGFQGNLGIVSCTRFG